MRVKVDQGAGARANSRLPGNDDVRLEAIEHAVELAGVSHAFDLHRGLAVGAFRSDGQSFLL